MGSLWFVVGIIGGAVLFAAAFVLAKQSLCRHGAITVVASVVAGMAGVVWLLTVFVLLFALGE